MFVITGAVFAARTNCAGIHGTQARSVTRSGTWTPASSSRRGATRARARRRADSLCDTAPCRSSYRAPADCPLDAVLPCAQIEWKPEADEVVDALGNTIKIKKKLTKKELKQKQKERKARIARGEDVSSDSDLDNAAD